MTGRSETSAPLPLPLIAAGAGAGVALLATGLYLWAVHGASIFIDMASAALAWCM